MHKVALLEHWRPSTLLPRTVLAVTPAERQLTLDSGRNRCSAEAGCSVPAADSCTAANAESIYSAQNRKLVLRGRDPPLLGGGEGGGGLSPAGKLGGRNVNAASDSLRSERNVYPAIKLIWKKIANDLHSIARPVWSLDDRATAFLPFDA